MVRLIAAGGAYPLLIVILIGLPLEVWLLRYAVKLSLKFKPEIGSAVMVVSFGVVGWLVVSMILSRLVLTFLPPLYASFTASIAGAAVFPLLIGSACAIRRPDPSASIKALRSFSNSWRSTWRRVLFWAFLLCRCCCSREGWRILSGGLCSGDPPFCAAAHKRN